MVNRLIYENNISYFRKRNVKERGNIKRKKECFVNLFYSIHLLLCALNSSA